eukprot:11164535-Lingulodinium_polyedra.AAC.1
MDTNADHVQNANHLLKSRYFKSCPGNAGSYATATLRLGVAGRNITGGRRHKIEGKERPNQQQCGNGGPTRHGNISDLND